MKMWPEKTEPLDKWLVKNETAVQSYEPIGYDISYVKEQREDAQVGAPFTPFLFHHKNYNFLDCDWFKKLLFFTNSLAKFLSDSLLSVALIIT